MYYDILAVLPDDSSGRLCSGWWRTKQIQNSSWCLSCMFEGVYLDGCCVQYKKPMLEGGTLGSKGSTLVVVPHLTESYGPGSSSGQTGIPLCTLKHFPHRIEHTLQVRLIHDWDCTGTFIMGPSSCSWLLSLPAWLPHSLHTACHKFDFHCYVFSLVSKSTCNDFVKVKEILDKFYVHQIGGAGLV